MIILGPVEIHIFKGRQTIDGSPLIIHAFDPSAVQIIDFPKKISVNTISSFLLDVAKAGKGSLQITIKGKLCFSSLQITSFFPSSDRSNRSFSLGQSRETRQRSNWHPIQANHIR